MGIFAKILSQLPLIPGIIQGIEYISKEAGTPGATKKQMALDALGLATGAAEAALPQFAPEIQAATDLASGTIDLIVKGFNVAGWTHPGILPVLPATISPATPPASGPVRIIG